MIIDLLVVGLVTFVVTYMVRNLDGPLDVFVKVRAAVGIVRYPVRDDNGDVVSYVDEIADTKIAKLFSCFWCLSTWVAMAATILYAISYHKPMISLPWIWLSSTAVSCIIYERLSE